MMTVYALLIIVSHGGGAAIDSNLMFATAEKCEAALEQLPSRGDLVSARCIESVVPVRR